MLTLLAIISALITPNLCEIPAPTLAPYWNFMNEPIRYSNGKCIGIDYSKDLYIYDCTGNKIQAWTMSADFGIISNAAYDNLCLEADREWPKLRTCTSAANQMWELIVTASSFKIMNGHNCLRKFDDSDRLQVATCGSNDEWQLGTPTPVATEPEPNTNPFAVDGLDVGAFLEAIKEGVETVWWDIDNTHLCDPAYNRGVGELPDCGGEYPDKEGLLCYGSCPADYNTQILHDCYKDCDAGWTDTGLFCEKSLNTVAKQTYDRGVGVFRDQCPYGKENQAGLCYDWCQEGWWGYGIDCYENYCPEDFTANGITCYQGLSVYWRKKYYRGLGTLPESCPQDKPDFDGLLCYQNCRSGFTGVATVCWEECSAGSTDIGALCELQSWEVIAKDHHFRTGGMLPDICQNGKELQASLCYEPCDEGYDGVTFLCWNKELGQSIALILASTPLFMVNTPVCSPLFINEIIANLAEFLLDPEGVINAFNGQNFNLFTSCMYPLLATMNAIDNKWSKDAITFAYEISATQNYFNDITLETIFELDPLEAITKGHSFMVGIAFNFPNADDMNIYVYHGQCEFTKLDVGGAGIATTYKLYRSVEDIVGHPHSHFALGVEFGVITHHTVPIGASMGYAINDHCEVVSLGMTGEVGAGSFNPVIVEGGVCLVKDETFTHIFKKRDTNNQYIFDGELMDWTNAENYCQSHYKTSLAKITSAEDTEEARQICGGTNTCWIGLNDINNEGTFVWSDGSATTYYNWADDQPDNWMQHNSNGEDCVELNNEYGQGKWNDQSCDVEYYPLCNAPNA